MSFVLAEIRISKRLDDRAHDSTLRPFDSERGVLVGGLLRKEPACTLAPPASGPSPSIGAAPALAQQQEAVDRCSCSSSSR